MDEHNFGIYSTGETFTSLQHDLFGNSVVTPIRKPTPKATKPLFSYPKYAVLGKKDHERRKLKSLFMNLVPSGHPVEGLEEFPQVAPYTGSLPIGVVAMDDSFPSDCSLLALHGFCNDFVLERKIRHIDKVIAQASRFLCVMAPAFSPYTDGRRCDAVAAIRLSRYFTVALQLSDVPTIQAAAWGNADSLNFAFDGLAKNCPTAVEHFLGTADKNRQRLFRKGLERLIEVKSPSVLLVVGFDIGFNPGIPVVYYPCRIQRLREFGQRIENEQNKR